MTRRFENTCVVDGCESPSWREVCRGCARKIRNGTLPEQGGVYANPECEVGGCTAPTATTKVTLCRGHQTVQEKGRPLESKRGKVRTLEPKPKCITTGCKELAATKGMCKAHYAKKRNPPKMKPCSAEGCPARSKNKMCKRHEGQFEVYGFTWNKEYPRERISAWRVERRPVCKIHKCDKKASSDESTMCATHRNDHLRKNCSEEFYEEIMKVERCESCGEEGRLVTDHDHACPHDKDKMCGGCIRGRLCNGCNTSLGLLGENLERVYALAEYLKRHSK